jgi:hypothetical protein
MAHTINCADCGAERTSFQKNTKYCVPCRIYRSLVWMGQNRGDRPRPCLVCDTVMVPLQRGDDLCAKCDVTWLDRVTPGVCQLCTLGNGLLHPDLPVCLSCAKTAACREAFLKLSGQGFRARKEAA